MARALTEGQAAAAKLKLLEARETEALEELEKLGFRVTLHDMPSYVEEDILTGTRAGWKAGDCYAVIYARDGKRKHVAGGSAVEALTQAQAWKRWQDGLKDDAPNKFVPSLGGEQTAVPVTQRVAGDTAETAARRASKRRVLSFASGIAEVVDAHGTPIGEDNHASQYREADDKEHTSR